MTTTPQEPAPEVEVVPSGDPEPLPVTPPEPEPGVDPVGVQPR